MGLDVTAYESCEFVTEDEKQGLALMEGEEWNSYRHVYGVDFPDRLGSLAPGYYRIAGQEHSFHAGGYIGYGIWRDWLGQQVGMPSVRYMRNPQSYEALPFFQLIYFSDCEGCIGPETSAKLAQDFADWEDRIQGDAQQMRLYLDFKKGFELASKGGFVEFS